LRSNLWSAATLRRFGLRRKQDKYSVCRTKTGLAWWHGGAEKEKQEMPRTMKSMKEKLKPIKQP